MKVLAAETNLGSATNVSNAPVVRLFNSGSSNILVTRKDYAGTVVGSFMVMSDDVVYCEKYFTDTLEGSSDVKATKTAYSHTMKFIGSGADPLPTYTHSVSATNVDEGGSFTTTITTTNVDDGTNLYWELTGVVADDFSSGALTGTASISSNSATFSHTVDEDNLTEGSETATIKVYSDSGRNTQVGNTLTVTIADTSTGAAYATEFDGTNDYVKVGGTTSIRDAFDLGTGAYTIEFWLKTTKGSQWILFNAATDCGFRIAMGGNAGGSYSGQLEINEQVSNGDDYTRTSQAVNDGNWHHIAISRASGVATKIFVDGSESVSGEVGRDMSGSSDLWIGRRSSGGPYFDGHLYGLRITKGQAIYTSNFTAPTEALTTTSQGATASNVQLLAMQGSNVMGFVKAPDDEWDAIGAVISSISPFD